jgi:serine/threonine protein phosphatase PrpC
LGAFDLFIGYYNLKSWRLTLNFGVIMILSKKILSLLILLTFFNLASGIKIDSASYYKIGRADQDTHSECTFLGNQFYGVFDGHGKDGQDIAQIASKQIAKNILWYLTHEKAYALLDAIPLAYENCNKYLHELNGGTTAVTAIIDKNNVYVANVGDSRAVLSKNGKAVQLTRDHKPNYKEEKERIQNLGGFVNDNDGIWRVLNPKINEGLAVSRAIGDLSYRPYVISAPHVGVLQLNEACHFLILATDGIWDYVANQEAVDVVNNSLRSNEYNVQRAAKDLVGYAYSKGIQRHMPIYIDDMTVTLIVFNKDEQLKHYNMMDLYNNCKKLGSYLLLGLITGLYIKKQLF